MELALATTTERKTQGFFWSDSASQFVSRIGYHHSRAGVRTRSTQYLGRFERAAAAIVHEKKEKWEAIKSAWPKYKKYMSRVHPSLDWSSPVWITDEMLAEVQEWYRSERTQTANLVQRIGDSNEQNAIDALRLLYPVLADQCAAERNRRNCVVTIREMIPRYLAAQESRVGMKAGKGTKFGSYKTTRKNLSYSLGISLAKQRKARLGIHKPINLDMPISRLQSSDLQAFVNYWCDAARKLGDRTIANYCRAFRAFLGWCAKQNDVYFTLPPDADDIFTFKKSKAKIKPYTPAMLKKLMDARDDRCKMFILCGLQGMYQADIAAILDGALVDHNEDHFVLWRRQKETDTNEFFVLTYLWPELYELIVKFRAKANKHNRLFLDDDGTPLWKNEPSGRKDKIGYEYLQAQKNADVDYEFVQLRKCGMNEVKRITRSDDAVRVRTVARNSVEQTANRAISV